MYSVLLSSSIRSILTSLLAASEQGIIEGAMDIIENETCVTFKKYTNESHWIQIEKSEGFVLKCHF